MGKTQLRASVDDEVAQLARTRAKNCGLSLGEYIAHLIKRDANGLHGRGLAGARHFLDEHQAVFDEAEETERSASTDTHSAS